MNSTSPQRVSAKLMAGALLLAVAAGACSGKGDNGLGEDGRLSPVDVVIRGCDPSCANGEARQSCLETSCANVMARCFGGSYPSGDYTGGVCEEDLECLASSPIACEAECAPTPTCIECVTNALTTCGDANDCPVVECDG